MNQINETLRRAYKRIENPAQWTQGTIARDADGNAVSDDAPEATCWCSVGSVWKESPNLNVAMLAHDVMNDFAFGRTKMPFSNYNDDHAHSEVMAFWREFLETLED